MLRHFHKATVAGSKTYELARIVPFVRAEKVLHSLHVEIIGHEFVIDGQRLVLTWHISIPSFLECGFDFLQIVLQEVFPFLCKVKGGKDRLVRSMCENFACGRLVALREMSRLHIDTSSVLIVHVTTGPRLITEVL